MFIMNFKEIHSNTEFLSTYRRAREIPLTGEMSQSDKRVCRIADLLLPNIKKYLTFLSYGFILKHIILLTIHSNYQRR